ncbi:MAG: type II secretion system F family protein, partial [Acidimicrobiales bacterium]
VFAAGLLGFVYAVRGTDPRAVPTVREQQQAAKQHASISIEHFTLRLALGLVAAVIVGIVTRWPMAALLIGIAGFLAPSLSGGRAARQAKVDKIEGIAAWAEMLRDTMAGAGGLEQSIVATAGVAPRSIRPEVVQLAARLERDRLAPSLREFADAIDDPTGDLVVAALVLAADKSPKRLGDLLGRLAEAARSEVNMRLRVDTSRARTRTSVKVIVVFTTAFATSLVLFNRAFLKPYDTFTGQMVLGLIGICFAGAFYWLSRSFQYEAEERFLRIEDAPS